MDPSALLVRQASPGHAPVVVVFGANPTVQSLFPRFIDQATSASSMQATVQALTAEVVLAARQRSPQALAAAAPVTLVPILRGALPMYAAASQLFPAASCVLVRGFRASDEGAKPRLEWLGRRPFPLEPDGAHIVLLDTVIATGGTILAICDELMALSGPGDRYITVLACYVSPAGLDAVARHPLVREVVVAAEAEGVDDKGYTVPYPGDIGDKLYGRPA